MLYLLGEGLDQKKSVKYHTFGLVPPSPLKRVELKNGFPQNILFFAELHELERVKKSVKVIQICLTNFNINWMMFYNKTCFKYIYGNS